MSDAIANVKISGLALKNDALRNAFALDGVRCFLLKRSGNRQLLEILEELTSGYRVKFADNRSESGLFRYASIDLTFRDVWSQASHIAYGVPFENPSTVFTLEVFNFEPLEKDAIDPDGSSVYWSGRIIKDPKERFTLP